jgi:hypothetical protein
MSPIDAVLVEKTWRDVAGYTARRVEREMEQAGNAQPALLAFVTASTEACSAEVQGLALYLYFAIFQMFKRGTSKRIPQIPEEAVEAQFDTNETKLQQLENAGPSKMQEAAQSELSVQPFVMAYLVEAIMEPGEDDAPTLTDDDGGLLFLVLKTVVDVLHEARERVNA